jgi:hypothetical protein
MPALLTGFALAFARAVGEYGSVIFIAGNIPMVSEITPLMIITKLEQYDYAGATAIAVVMLVFSFTLLLPSTACRRGPPNVPGGNADVGRCCSSQGLITAAGGRSTRYEANAATRAGVGQVAILGVSLTFFAVFLLMPLARCSSRPSARAGTPTSRPSSSRTPSRRSS